MSKEKTDKFIKEEIEKHNSEISETTRKAVDDAIKGNFDPPKSERSENSLTGALIGILGGPIGIITGAAIGALAESKDRKEYDEVYEKTKEELEKTK